MLGNSQSLASCSRAKVVASLLVRETYAKPMSRRPGGKVEPPRALCQKGTAHFKRLPGQRRIAHGWCINIAIATAVCAQETVSKRRTLLPIKWMRRPAATATNVALKITNIEYLFGWLLASAKKAAVDEAFIYQPSEAGIADTHQNTQAEPSLGGF